MTHTQLAIKTLPTCLVVDAESANGFESLHLSDVQQDT